MRKLMLGALALLALTACGERVIINTGEVGKQITTSGLEDEIRRPGAFRLEACPFSACPKLVTLDVAVSAQTITIDRVFLPKSNVPLDDVSFGIIFRVKPDEASINQAYEIRSADKTDTDSSRLREITSEMLFSTYIERKVPETVIAALREFTVEQAMTDVENISQYVLGRVNKKLADTPVELIELGFPNGIGNPPQAVLTAKEMLYAVTEEQARRVAELEAELAIEEQRQAVQRVRAKNDAEIAKELGMTVAEYMALKTTERFADAAQSGTPVALGGQYIPMTKE